MTGTISANVRLTAGSRKSITTCEPVVAPAQPRQRQQELDHASRRGSRPRRRRASWSVAVHVRDAEHEPGDDREVPEDRAQRRDAEVVVAVEDPDDDPGQPEQRRRSGRGRARGRPRGRRSRRSAPHHPRRDQDEQRRQPAEPEQHQPEEGRGDAPRPLALALLEQVAEDGHEGGRERGVGDERADGVRDEERDLERVDLRRRCRSSSGRRSRGRARARARARWRARRSRSSGRGAGRARPPPGAGTGSPADALVERSPQSGRRTHG